MSELMALPVTTRDASQLMLRAAFQPKGVNAEKRTAELVWSTGAAVLRRDYEGQFFEELSMDPAHVRMGRLNNGAPFLANHDGYDVGRVLGVVESARLENSQGLATVRFPAAGISPEADTVFRLIQDGIVQNVSVGYRVHKFEKSEGGDAKVPTYRATDWEPYEISAVAMGADDGAGFRSLTRGKSATEQHNMNEEEKKAAELKAADEARAEALKVEAVKAERERAEAIRKAVRSAKLTPEFGDKLVSQGVELGKAREMILDEIATRSESYAPNENAQHVRVEVTDDQHDKFMRGAEAACFVRGGVADRIEAAAKNPLTAKSLRGVETDPGEFRRMSLVDLAREFLDRRGVKTTGRDPMTLVRDALEYRAGGMSTSSDFAVLLENVMYKTLLGFYATTPDTWTQFCKVDSVQDFRPSNRYRLGSFGVLDQINEEGEFKNKSIPDGEKHSISVLDYGNIIALSRKAIVNDDMGALVAVAERFGRASALSIEVAVYALLAQNAGLGPTMSDSLPLFDAGHGNVGTGSALAVAGLDADRVLMKAQKDPSGNEYLDLVPATMLVPASLGATARLLNTAPYDPTASQFQKPNVVNGLFRSVVDTARLSGTRRYIFSDPNVSSALVVAFLNGQRTPFMEQRMSWRVDGIEWKLRHDFQAQAFDYRGCVTNAGV